MKLRDFFTKETACLDLESDSQDDLLQELVELLGLDDKSEKILFKTLKRRENLGSTGIGKGIAIPHCRSLVVDRLRLAYGRKPTGVAFNAIDSQPVDMLFALVVPREEVNMHLDVLACLAAVFGDESERQQLRNAPTASELNQRFREAVDRHSAE